MLKPKRLIWQRRILLACLAVVCSLVVDLLLPMKAPTQQATLPLVSQPEQQQITFSVGRQFQGKIIKQVNLSYPKKAIALTFDDGPHPVTTPQVLSILKNKHVKATFFLIGRNLNKFPKIGQQLVADGHTVGNHTWHHWSGMMLDFMAASEIDDTAALLKKITGVKTSLFRPPNGHLFNGLVDYARQQKDLVVLWSVDAGDWRGSRATVNGIVSNVLQKVKPGAIVLMHDGGGDRSRTVLALPKIIDELKARGYTFVSVPELLQISDPDINDTTNASVVKDQG